MRSLVAAIAALLLSSCGSVVPTISPASTPIAALTPTPSPTPTASPTPKAVLTITAAGDYTKQGDCPMFIGNMGGCSPMLVVDPLGLAHAASWVPGEPAIAFDTSATPWAYPVQPNLSPGTYGVVLTILGSSDSCMPIPTGQTDCRYGQILCSATVDVTALTQRVVIDADYGDPCRVTVKTVP